MSTSSDSLDLRLDRITAIAVTVLLHGLLIGCWLSSARVQGQPTFRSGTASDAEVLTLVPFSPLPRRKTENAKPRPTTTQAQPETSAQAAAADTASQAGDNGTLSAKYRWVLRDAILYRWARPEGAAASGCVVHVSQSEGGMVAKLSVEGCAREEDRTSLEMATLMAQPLPYAGWEPVFAAEMTIDIDAAER